MILCASWLCLSATVPGRANIIDVKQISIDFTNQVEAAKKADWSNPDKILVTKDGLGLAGEGTGLGGWIQTKPVALGLSWRPPYAISVRITIQPPPREFAPSSGPKMTPDAGQVYVRYSPDRLNWSSWQTLERVEPPSGGEKKPGRYYGGTIRVPQRERSDYEKLASDYSELDVPWKSDEEAAVQWILGRDPGFFSKHIPFIGYAEILFEADFYGGQRIKSFAAEIWYGMGGLSSPPKDESVEKDRGEIPWRFEAKVNRKAVPGDPASGASRRP